MQGRPLKEAAAVCPSARIILGPFQGSAWRPPGRTSCSQWVTHFPSSYSKAPVYSLGEADPLCGSCCLSVALAGSTRSLESLRWWKESKHLGMESAEPAALSIQQ